MTKKTTANHRTIPVDYPHAIGFSWAPPYRYGRIAEVLRGKEKFSLEDFERLQHDEVSLPARELVTMLPASAPVFLREWDGNLSRDSSAAALYQVLLRKLRPRLLQPLVPAELWTSYAESISLPVILDLLRRQPAGARQALFEASLADAREELRSRLGPEAAGWRWGGLHKAAFEHPLAKEFDLPEVSRGGDGTTPNATTPNAAFRQVSGASYRQVLDLADWDRSRATSVPGQSGQPGSPHYGDLLPIWSEGRYFPLLFSRQAVEKAAKEKLILAPRR